VAKKFSILAFDLHNTIYDEVMEYGLAIDEAIEICCKAARVDRETLYRELSAAHRKLGSDWDESVWQQLPCLKNISPEVIAKAIKARQEKSRQLTVDSVYAGVIETLKRLKQDGVRLYMVTEAAADAAMRAVSWLGLDGVIDGVYSYPSREPPLALPGTYHRIFPDGPDKSHLKKPNPLLLAAVALDDAKKTKNIPQPVELQDVFGLTRDEKLLLKEGPYKDTLQKTLDSMLFVGDSKFRDGFLARNAGVKFAFAAYGKKIKPGEEETFKKSRDILYAVTGWDKETLRLTQEAERSQAVLTLQPDFIFEESLAEALSLFTG
jgi:phosphoglycolate phosphatase-like HAD superfamily hydrolase